ncbi:MAG: hypothetical protein WBW76_12915 [Candidatus Cybelea sp.]|jgi:hypothetical protein
MDPRVPPVHVLDAREFGMHPAKSAAENRRALEAMLAQAVDGARVEIRIPAIGTYEIAGEVEVEPEPGASATIEGSGGRAELRQTEEGKGVFNHGNADRDKPTGDVALRDISLEGRQQLRDVGEGIYIAGDGGLEQDR